MNVSEINVNDLHGRQSSEEYVTGRQYLQTGILRLPQTQSYLHLILMLVIESNVLKSMKFMEFSISRMVFKCLCDSLLSSFQRSLDPRRSVFEVLLIALMKWVLF